MAAPATRPVLTLYGASGTPYTFTLYPYGTTFTKECVVYAIVAAMANGYLVSYVGQTGDCSERFDAHHKEACFRRNGATHIGLLVERTERRRLTIEADLIAKHRPSCNG
jgi:hypothetical protein